MRTALITGINGMDGSHLADFLLNKGYEVWGIERRSSSKNRTNTKHLEQKINFHFFTADLTDQNSLYRALKLSQPDEVYNLASKGGQYIFNKQFGKRLGQGQAPVEFKSAEQVIKAQFDLVPPGGFWVIGKATHSTPTTHSQCTAPP